MFGLKGDLVSLRYDGNAVVLHGSWTELDFALAAAGSKMIRRWVPTGDEAPFDLYLDLGKLRRAWSNRGRLPTGGLPWGDVVIHAVEDSARMVSGASGRVANRGGVGDQLFEMVEGADVVDVVDDQPGSRNLSSSL